MLKVKSNYMFFLLIIASYSCMIMLSYSQNTLKDNQIQSNNYPIKRSFEKYHQISEDYIKQINQKYYKTYQNQTLLADEQKYYLLQQLNLKLQEGVIRSFSSLQYCTFNEQSMVTVTQNNRALVWICDANMITCKKAPNIVINQSMSIQSSALSDDKQLFVLGSSNSKVYVYQRKSPAIAQFNPIGIINDSSLAVKSMKMLNGASGLITGGADKIPRYYKFNQTSPTLYTLFQNLTSVPSQIFSMAILQIFSRNSYVFVAFDQGVKVYVLNTTTGKYDQSYTISISNVLVIAAPVSVNSQGVGALAIGTKAIVKMYQFYSSLNKLVQVQTVDTATLGQIKSISLSQNGNYMIVGNHNYQTYIYKKTILNNGTYQWDLFETIHFSTDTANFATVVKFRSDGKYLIAGSDDLYLRFYGFGSCPDSTTFDGYGRCQQKSYIGLIVGLSVGGVLIIGAVIFICKKRIVVPAQSTKGMIDYQDDIKVPADRQPFAKSDKYLTDNDSKYNNKNKNIGKNYMKGGLQ